MKILFLLPVFWLCLQPLRAEDPKPKFVWKPDVMSVMIGGAFGQSYEITYDESDYKAFLAAVRKLIGERKFE